MSSTRQGLLRDIKLPPGVFRRGINLWPPFLGAGVRVTRVADDYREIDVTLKLGLLNRNYFGTQFGGSMFAMTDPFFALMMLHNLGSDYVVWDRAGAIRYLKPGRGNVFAHFRLAAAAIARARAATTRGRKHEPTFTVAIVDGDGATIAEVDKTLYPAVAAPDSPAAKAAAAKSAAPPRPAETAAGRLEAPAKSGRAAGAARGGIESGHGHRQRRFHAHRRAEARERAGGGARTRAAPEGARRIRRPGKDPRPAVDLHRGRAEAPRIARPRAAVRPAGTGQDDAVAHHRARARREPAADVGAGAGAPGRPRGAADQPRAQRRPVHRRDPPPVADRRGDPLPGARGLTRSTS